jgi:flavoprotein
MRKARRRQVFLRNLREKNKVVKLAKFVSRETEEVCLIYILKLKDKKIRHELWREISNQMLTNSGGRAMVGPQPL